MQPPACACLLYSLVLEWQDGPIDWETSADPFLVSSNRRTDERHSTRIPGYAPHRVLVMHSFRVLYPYIYIYIYMYILYNFLRPMSFWMAGPQHGEPETL